MKIAVLISCATHPNSGKQIPSPLDLKACALAFALKEKNHSIEFIHFGDTSAAIHDYLAYGLNKITCYVAPSHFDIRDIGTCLSSFDIVLLGRRALSDFGSGLFAYQLAKELKADLHSNIIDISVSEQTLTLTQYLPNGFRRHLDLAAGKAPYIITVHESVSQQLPYSYQALRRGEVVVEDKQTITPYQAKIDWQVRAKKQLRQRLKVSNELSQLSGSDRMKQAVSSGSSGGGQVQKLSSEQAAQAIWQLLKDKKML